MLDERTIIETLGMYGIGEFVLLGWGKTGIRAFNCDGDRLCAFLIECMKSDPSFVETVSALALASATAIKIYTRENPPSRH